MPLTRDQERRALRLLEFCVAARLDHEPAKLEDAEAAARKYGSGSSYEVGAQLLRYALAEAFEHADEELPSLDAFSQDERRRTLKERARYFSLKEPGVERAETTLSGHLKLVLQHRHAAYPQVAPARVTLDRHRSWSHYICDSRRVRPVDEDEWQQLSQQSPLWRAHLETASQSAPEEPLQELWLLIFEHGQRKLLTLDGVRPDADIQEGSATLHSLRVREAAENCYWYRDRDGTTRFRVGRSFTWTFLIRGSSPESGALSEMTAEYTQTPRSAWVSDWERYWKRPIGALDPGVGPRGVALRLAESALPETKLGIDEALVGSWIKLSEEGGSYGLRVNADGTVSERNLLHPDNPQLDGYWWVERNGTPARFHVWFGFWRLSVPEVEDKQLEDKLGRPLRFALPNGQRALMRCSEEEPRAGRRGEFLVARLWTPQGPRG